MAASARSATCARDLTFGLYHLALRTLGEFGGEVAIARAGAGRAAATENLFDRRGADGHRRGTRDRQCRTDRATLVGRVGVTVVRVRSRPSMGGFSPRHTSLRTSGAVFSHHSSGSGATTTCRHWRFSGPAVSARRSDRRGKESGSTCYEYHYGQSRVEPAVRKQSAGGPQQPNIGQQLPTVFPQVKAQIADIQPGRDTPWPLSGLQANSSSITSWPSRGCPVLIGPAPSGWAAPRDPCESAAS